MVIMKISWANYFFCTRPDKFNIISNDFLQKSFVTQAHSFSDFRLIDGSMYSYFGDTLLKINNTLISIIFNQGIGWLVTYHNTS